MDFTKDIYINKEKICEDSEFVILYKGDLFSNDLTKDVFISYGYGSNWENKQEIQLKPSTFGYLATIKVDSGSELQFCFRDNEGNWDNNNSQNYVLPISESEEVLTFKPVLETAKEVTLDIVSESENTVDDFSEIFEPEIIEINEIDLYKTVDLEETAKPTIPNNTLFTQVDLEKNPEDAFSDAVIQTPTIIQNVSIDYAKLEEEAKQKALNPEPHEEVAKPVVGDVPKKVENLEHSKALVTRDEEDELDYVPTSFFGSIINGVKTAFSKVVKLVKSAFDFGDNED